MQSDIGREGTIDRRAPAVEASMARLADEAQGAGERPGVDDQLSRLMDLLVALRVDLTTGLMPRAARITGTSDRLYAAVDRSLPPNVALHDSSLFRDPVCHAPPLRRLAPSHPVGARRGGLLRRVPRYDDCPLPRRRSQRRAWLKGASGIGQGRLIVGSGGKACSPTNEIDVRMRRFLL